MQRMLGYTAAGYWRFLARPTRGPSRRARSRAARRARARADHEPEVAHGSPRCATPPDAADARVARAGVAKTETCPGLTLAEPDYIALALELAVREVPAWQAILDSSSTRIENPDRKARFEFVRPALSPDHGEARSVLREL